MCDGSGACLRKNPASVKLPSAVSPCYEEPMKPMKIPRLDNYQHPDKFGALLGYEVVSVDAARMRASVRLKLRDDHLSPAGRIHGGVVAAFIDFACGAAVFTTLDRGDFCSTVELKVNYFKALMSGDVLDAEPVVVFRGNRLCVVHVMVYRGKRKAKVAVAMATATFNIVSGKKAAVKKPRS